MDFKRMSNIGLPRKAGMSRRCGIVGAAQATWDSGFCLAIFFESCAASWERSLACWVNS